MDLGNIMLSDVQREHIYQQMLVPLKAKISQITLYDTEAALNFLQKYNEIIKNEEKFGINILHEITTLEFEIQEYENLQGKEKEFEERSKGVLHEIEDIKRESIQLELEDFEIKVAKLKRKYKENLQNYSFEDREIIEGEIHNLQAILIIRQVSNGKTTEELQQDINEQDKIELEIWVNRQINKLMQEENSNLRAIGTKIRNIILTDQDAIRDIELWKWLDSAINSSEIKNKSQESKPAAMMIVPKKENSGTIGNKILKFFSKDPIFPLQIKDLGKISINWLGQYIPKFVLQELEDNRVNKEGIETNQRYLPDSRTPIYEMFKSMEKGKNSGKYFLLTENGGKIKVEIIVEYVHKYIDHIHRFCDVRKTTIKMKTEECEKSRSYTESFPEYKNFGYLNEAIQLAMMIDISFNTDFHQQLLKEIKGYYIDNTIKTTPIGNCLVNSWSSMYNEYKNTQLEFIATEKKKRDDFYKKINFFESVKVERENMKTNNNQANEGNNKALDEKDYLEDEKDM